MSDLDALQDAFLKADEAARRGNEQAKRDALMFAQEIRRLQSAAPDRGGADLQPMAQFNRGVANATGGLVDFVNPFDNAAWEGTPFKTGSARAGLAQGMEAIGANVAPDRPVDGVGEAFSRGAGEAAAVLAPVAKGLQMLSGAGGAVGAFARDALKAIGTVPGVLAEGVAGGASEAAREKVEQEGGGPIAQGVAAVAAPVGVMGAAAAGRAAVGAGGAAAQRLPVTGAAIRIARDARAALTPMTEGGAMEVARRQLENVVGPNRTGQLAQDITPDNPLNLTPAQQTGDPGLLGLERAAREESPELAARLDARAEQSRDLARAEVSGMGGDVAEARRYLSESFAQRSQSIRDELNRRVDRALMDAANANPRASRPPSQISAAAVEKVRGELSDALDQERALWAAIPMQGAVDTTQTRAAIADLVENQAWAQRGNVPNDLRAILEGGTPIEGQTTIRELHGLYSQMRMIARNAMAGTNQNRDVARIANKTAEAVLDDLAAISDDAARQAVDDARAYSKALHETFDTGAVGRILQRTIDGDEQIEPATALRRTIGQGKEGGAAAVEDIRRAAPAAASDMREYLTARFADALIDATGEFSRKRAATWLRDNREALAAFPGLREQFGRAIANNEAAQAYAVRMQARAQLDGVGGPVLNFTRGQEKNAINAILGADDPAAAARSLVASARKDKSGKALAGLKGAFTDYLIGQNREMSAKQFQALLTDKATRPALQKVFSAGEIGRMQRIASELGKLETRGREVGPLLDAPVNRILEAVARVAGAKAGTAFAKAAGGPSNAGVSLQAANIGSNRARDFMARLTNERARQLLMDAIEDPELMRLLLEPARSGLAKPSSVSRLAPYLTGAGAASATE